MPEAINGPSAARWHLTGSAPSRSRLPGYRKEPAARSDGLGPPVGPDSSRGRAKPSRLTRTRLATRLKSGQTTGPTTRGADTIAGGCGPTANLNVGGIRGRLVTQPMPGRPTGVTGRERPRHRPVGGEAGTPTNLCRETRSDPCMNHDSEARNKIIEETPPRDRKTRSMLRFDRLFCPARPPGYIPRGPRWPSSSRHRPLGRRHTLSHPLTNPIPHCRRPTNAGRSAAAKSPFTPHDTQPRHHTGRDTRSAAPAYPASAVPVTVTVTAFTASVTAAGGGTAVTATVTAMIA